MTKPHNILASLLVLGVVLAVGPTPAFAEHKLEHAFGSGHFAGIAVDQETGNVYVDNHGSELENEPEAIDVFGADGGLPTGGVPNGFTVSGEAGPVAVDNACEQQVPALTETTTPKCSEFDPSNGDVYVAAGDEHTISKLALNASDEYEVLATFTSPVVGEIRGIAVDDQGNVYVAGGEEEYPPIVEFDAEGKEVAKIGQHAIKHPGDIAVGAPGVIYIGVAPPYNEISLGVVKLVVGSGGQVSSEAALDPQARAVAIDPRTGIVYADNESSISEYDSAGEYLGGFGGGVISESQGVAVNDASGEVYVSNGAKDVRPIDAFKEEFVPGAKISEEQATDVNQTAATLQADINPNKSNTRYHFEYDTTPYESAASQGTSLPSHGRRTPEVGIGSEEISVLASARVEGLDPGTTYYYRVVASSEIEVSPGHFKTEEFAERGEVLTTPALPGLVSETCSNAGLRAEQPFGLTLPDCRAYEMVSPLDKNDSDIEAGGARASVPGPGEAQALTYLSRGAFADPLSAQFENRYIARRGADGWVTQSINQPAYYEASGTFPPFNQLLFTPELSRGLVKSIYDPLVGGEPAGFINLYVADLASSPVSYQTATPVTPPGVEPSSYDGGSGEQPQPGGVSTDLSHVVFQQDASLTAGASPGHEHVYEWAAGKLSQVDVPPEKVKFKHDDQIGGPAEKGPEQGDTWHAVSENGSRVFFTGGESSAASEEELGQLYVREDPIGSTEEECSGPGEACTVEVSKSQRTTCNVQRKAIEPPTYVCNGKPEPDPHGPQPAWFRDASANGERVFFTSRAELTNDAYTGPDDNAANLYECELVEVEETPVCKLTDLTVDDEAATNGASVLGLVNAGEDGSYVYFVANGVLSQSENAAHQKAQPGSCPTEEGQSEAGEHTCSLYLAHYNGTKWEAPKFVATLAAGDLADWIGYENVRGAANESGPGHHTARVTADGTTLAFESERSLTGYNNQQSQRGECEGGSPTGLGTETGKCREVYVYHAPASLATEAATLLCASCDPSGARPVGPAQLGGHPGKANGESPFYLPRNLSENGGRLFFQTPDPLISADTDGKVDVYEWEQPGSPGQLAAGESSCTGASPAFSARSGGCIYPISDVAGDYESDFMDASPSGNDVFVATADQLVPSDTDTRVDVYDVRVGGGFPVTVSPPPCTSECKPPASPQPSIFGAGPTETFSGIGNPLPPPPPPVKKVTTKTVKCKPGFVKKKVKKKEVCVKKPKKSSKAKKSAHANRGARS